MKVIVVGNNHAGTAFVNNVTEMNKNMEVVSYEKSDNISFLACGIALWVGNVIKDPKGLFYATSADLQKKGITVNMKHEITAIDYNTKTVTGKDLTTGKEFTDTYDKLVLASGSIPICPPIEGVDLEGVFFSKTYQQASDIINYAKLPHVKEVCVIGGGYIGIELVEAFHQLGKKVRLIEGTPEPLGSYFDPAFTDVVTNSLKKNQVQVNLDERVSALKGDKKVSQITTDKGTYSADMVIIATGFRPNNTLYKGQLKTLENGALIVNKYLQTSDPDVFACGDCVAVLSNVMQGSDHIALATNAVRTGILCAANIVHPVREFDGVQGSNAIKVFDLNMASTGLSETAAKKRGFQVLTNTIVDNARPEFMPTNAEVRVKVVYDATTRRLLGAQIQSTENHSEAIHTFSLAIAKKMTVDELALTDFFFLPHYNKPVSWLTLVCLTAP